MPPQPPPPVVRSVLAARRLARRAADRLIPTQFTLFEETTGVARTHILGTLAELRVPDLVGDGKLTAAEVAAGIDGPVDEDALHRVMRAAVTLGVLRLDHRGRFSLTASGRHLREDDPHSVAAWARYIASPATTRAWADLTETVRTGEPAFPRVHGRSVWAHLAANPAEEAAFAGGMRRLTEEALPEIVAGYPWPEQGRVADIAGGMGTLLSGILAARPQLRGVLVDARGVLAEADGFLTRRGQRDRVELVEGDIFGSVEAEADVYVLKNVLHDWDDARCADVLATTRAAMRPGATLVLIEALQERNEADPFVSISDVQMLTQCDGGRERSEAELHALLRPAGFDTGPTRRLALNAVLEATAT